jgi:hypothetical protein
MTCKKIDTIGMVFAAIKITMNNHISDFQSALGNMAMPVDLPPTHTPVRIEQVAYKPKVEEPLPLIDDIQAGEFILLLDVYDEKSNSLEKADCAYQMQGEAQPAKTYILQCSAEDGFDAPSYANRFRVWYEQWDKMEGRRMSKAYLETSGLLTTLQRYPILIFDRIDKPSQGVFLLELLSFLRENSDLPLPTFVLRDCGDVPVVYANADRILDVATGKVEVVEMEFVGF